MSVDFVEDQVFIVLIHVPRARVFQKSGKVRQIHIVLSCPLVYLW